MEKCLRPILVTALTLASIFLVLAQFSGIATADGVQVISASPGQTVNYQGHGSPNSQARMEVTATISLGVDNNRYYKELNGVQIPGGSSFSITASPVSTFSVQGHLGLIGMTIGSVSGNTGSASMGNLPGGTYNIVVTGISNGSSVSMTVHAYQTKSVGPDGIFTASISTAGLPDAVYSVKQDGKEVAKVYLGAQAPATPTPTAPPAPTPTAGPTSELSGSVTATIGAPSAPAANATTNQSMNVSSSPTSSVWISPTAEPAGSAAGGSLLSTVGLFSGAVVAGLLIGYIIVFRVLKK